jgi:hypothetical protein
VAAIIIAIAIVLVFYTGVTGAEPVYAELIDDLEDLIDGVMCSICTVCS